MNKQFEKQVNETIEDLKNTEKESSSVLLDTEFLHYDGCNIK